MTISNLAPEYSKNHFVDASKMVGDHIHSMGKMAPKVERIADVGKTITAPQNEAWEKLFNLLDNEVLTCYDFIACLCCKLAAEPQKTFKARLPLADYDFVVEIKKNPRK